MTDLTPYTFEGYDVRTAVGDSGSPLFVLADVCRVLGLTSPTRVAERLHPDDLSTIQVIDSMGRAQKAHAITESGVIDVTLDSRKPDARRFRRWLTHEVVPSIARTGSYSTTPALTEDEIVHRALTITARKVEALTEQVAELEPRATAWDVHVSAHGDYSVAEAAKVLARDHDIDTGRNRLFDFMAEIGWTYRHGSRSAWHAYQRHIENGRLTMKANPPFTNQRTGELELPAPTIRITGKGLDELRRRLTGQRALEIVS